MKKILSGFIILIMFIFIYMLQSNFFNWFTIFEVSPNLFILLVLFIGLFGGRWIGLASGVILGIILDLFIGTVIGISAIMLGVIRNTWRIFRSEFF